MQPIDAPYLFELEKKIIAKYRTFRNIDPKPIKLVENTDFYGRADEGAILVSILFLRKNPKVEEIEKLLKHELCHYVCQDEGHSLNFCAKSRKLKIDDNYDYNSLITEANKSWLEGRLSLKANDKGEEVLIDHKRPSYKRFRDYITDKDIPVSTAFKMLRQLHGLSVNELAKKTGLGIERIAQIEKDSDIAFLYSNEFMAKKVFKAIVCQSSKV